MTTSINDVNSNTNVSATYKKHKHPRVDGTQANWQQALIEAMSSTDDSSEDTDSDLLSSLTGTSSSSSSTDALSSLSGSLSANTVMHMPPPPPPPLDSDELSALADKAGAAGVLTDEEVQELKDLAEKQKESQGPAGLDPQIFKILQQYMASASTSSTGETEDDESVQAAEKARLEKLKEALATAKTNNALTADQIADVESFISDREKFATLMDKIQAAGLLTPTDTASTTTTTSTSST